MSFDLRFSHFGLFVTDLSKMRDFYTRVMGFAVNDAGFSRMFQAPILFLSRHEEVHHQIVLVEKRPAEIGFNVLNQMSFRLPSLGDLRRFVAEIEGEDIAELGPLNHGNAWSVYFKDPERNPIEIYVDSPWYTPQPCGEPLDLRRDDTEIYAETEALCRRVPGFMSREAWMQGAAARIAAASAARAACIST
jgi:catechol 2,3-dioxygenase